MLGDLWLQQVSITVQNRTILHNKQIAVGQKEPQTIILNSKQHRRDTSLHLPAKTANIQ